MKINKQPQYSLKEIEMDNSAMKRFNTITKSRSASAIVLGLCMAFSSHCFSKPCDNGSSKQGKQYLLRNNHIFYGEISVLKDPTIWAAPDSNVYEVLRGVTDVQADPLTFHDIPPNRKSSSCKYTPPADVTHANGKTPATITIDPKLAPTNPSLSDSAIQSSVDTLAEALGHELGHSLDPTGLVSISPLLICKIV